MSRIIKGILFDKDGTLIDYNRTWVPINIRAAEHASGGDADLRDRLLELGGQDLDAGTVRGGSLLAASNTSEIAAAWREAGAVSGGDLVADLDSIFTEGAAGSVPVCDLPALFARLRGRDLRLGVATSDSAAGARATLETLGVAADGLFVAGYDSGHGVKPEAGMAHGFMQHYGLAPAEVAVIGDNLHDMEMGRAAECGLCVGVLTGTATEDELARVADHIIAGIDRLEDLLDRLSADPAPARPA
ncbi:phosphoglycolate phosphatase [Tranquillimonas rosea]|uniref:phosphoglycolate phosphatase n=1 Tax=Tranquillimonas rosea TaxID=641238 RepID=A0A1H9WUD6_9RHOB|nr:HAD family hydrolase [Tranquillimonas rosea]SES37399.1 phosphoglycolate phosphatase [Tranquillimonas rosea]